jgi:hypothetical protein
MNMHLPSGRFHMAHAMHRPHPIHWLGEHPMLLAALIAGLVAWLVVALASWINTGIKQETLDPFLYPASISFLTLISS